MMTEQTGLQAEDQELLPTEMPPHPVEALPDEQSEASAKLPVTEFHQEVTEEETLPPF